MHAHIAQSVDLCMVKKNVEMLRLCCRGPSDLDKEDMNCYYLHFVALL